MPKKTGASNFFAPERGQWPMGARCYAKSQIIQFTKNAVLRAASRQGFGLGPPGGFSRGKSGNLKKI